MNYFKSFFFLLFFSLSAFSAVLTLVPNDNSFFKGETIYFSGSCNSNDLVDINIFLDEKKILATNVSCDNDHYSFSYNVSFTDPKGVWTIIAENANSKIEKKILIQPKKESEYFFISFLSPAIFYQNKGSTINVSVKITDARKPVLDANVFSWDAEGRKIMLENNGNGIYSTKIFIPFDSPLKEWNLIVVAEGFSNNIKAAGENSLKLSIENSLILIQLIKPEVETFDLSSELEILVKAQYDNEMQLIEPKVFASIDDINFVLNKENEFFSGKIKLSDFKEGTKELKIIAFDKYGNTASIKKVIVLKRDVLSTILSFAPIIILIIGILFLAFLLYFFLLRKYFVLENLRTQKIALEKEIKQLQEDFFNKNMYSIAEYKEKLSKLERELAEITKKLEIR